MARAVDCAEALSPIWQGNGRWRKRAVDESSDQYGVLGVPRTAAAREIESAYRNLVRRTHPDAGGTDWPFRLVQEAYETLSDPVRRAEYDRSGDSAIRDETPEPPPAGTKWARLDQPGSQMSGAYPPLPPSAVGPYGAPHTVSPPPGWWAPPTKQAPRGPVYQTETVQVRPVGGVARFVSNRPWIVPLAIGILFLLVFRPLVVLGLLVFRPLVVLGLLFLVIGLIAATGSRKARARFTRPAAGIGQTDRMDGTTFEHFTAEVLRANGYRVEHVGQTADYGADLIITNQSGRAVVQVKRYSGSVGVDAVREAAAARPHYGTDRAIVLTNSFFTPNAVALARSNAVDLWDRNVLVNLVTRSLALPPPSALTMFLWEIGYGLATCGIFLVALLSFLVALLVSLPAVSATTGSTRRRSAASRRRRRR